MTPEYLKLGVKAPESWTQSLETVRALRWQAVSLLSLAFPWPASAGLEPAVHHSESSNWSLQMLALLEVVG